ncbi:Anaphase-promoting complex subunit 4 WD40 domain-containing protein [Plasmodiophora brassicae]|uniref:WD repeat-containing protein 54 beta-propeller domain-containing protein n=1 Tax=Plasmodiophora brassicae TaxID=37360 RepID=A0A0G4IQB8_PLABS|nr:hypothetical protein PBRA_000898 [Plasmodiophora brassicae]
MSLSLCARLTSKYTASLQPNNLSYLPGSAGAIIISAGGINEKVLRSPASLTDGIAVEPMTVPYEETDMIAQVKWERLSFGIVLVLVTNAGLVQIYNHAGQRLLHFFRIECDPNRNEVPDAARGIASNGIDLIFVGSYTGEVITLQVSAEHITRGKALSGSTAHRAPITDIAAERSADTQTLVTADATGQILVWDLSSLVLIANLGTFHSRCNSIAVYGTTVVAAFLSGHVRIFNCREETHLEITAHSRAINAMCISPVTKRWFCVSEDTFLSMYTLPDSSNMLSSLHSIVVSPGLLTGLAVDGPCGTVAVTCYDSGEIFLVKVNE